MWLAFILRRDPRLLGRVLGSLVKFLLYLLNGHRYPLTVTHPGNYGALDLAHAYNPVLSPNFLQTVGLDIAQLDNARLCIDSLRRSRYGVDSTKTGVLPQFVHHPRIWNSLDRYTPIYNPSRRPSG